MPFKKRGCNRLIAKYLIVYYFGLTSSFKASAASFSVI